ncbi:GEVED domain-containing protein, partial [Sulfurovum sp.]
MKYIQQWLKLLILITFTTIFVTSLHAVDIELDNTITKTNGDGNLTTCLTGDIYRLGTNASYNGQALDLLVEITAEDNEYDQITQSGNCIDVDSGILETRLRDRDADDNLAYMDLKITVVEQGTTNPVDVDRIVFTGFDLDKNNATSGQYITGTDDIYMIAPSRAYIQANGNSDVTYGEGSYGSGYDVKLKGKDDGNCNDSATSPDAACRGGGIAIVGPDGPNNISSVNLRVSNDNAYGDTDHASAYRLIDISFKEADFEAILIDHNDHGDAPSSYGDAKHQSTVYTVLGYGFPPDNEAAQYSTNADADDDPDTGNINFDDEDGVRIGSQPTVSSELNMTVGFDYDLNVTSVGTGYLSAWIDLNGDGDFSDAGEQLLSDYAISSTVAVETIIPISVPSDNYTGQSYVRFRFSENTGVGSSGDGGKGEVEDYTVFFNPAGNIVGHIYNDLNGNGTQDAGEPDLADVNITITAANGEIQTVSTDANGDYNATAVAVGDATVDIDENTLPAGALQTEGGDPTTVTVNADEDNFEENNGYQMQANLVTTKVVDNSTLNEGDTVVYTITVTNNGAAQATNVSLTDTLPAGVSYVSDDSAGAYDAGTGLWTIGTLNNGATATLKITATVDAGTSGDTITNTTTAASTPDQNDPSTTGDDLNESITV